jgi:alanine racemase
MEFPTWAEVDLDRFARNVASIDAAIGPGCSVLLVVKADAYGHGAVEIARAAVDAGVSMLGVATLHEGIELRTAGLTTPIVILSPSLASEAEEILEHRLTPCVSSLGFADLLARRAAARETRARIHVEVDTGMGRTGVSDEDAVEFLKRVSAMRHLELEGVFTHFPDADSGNTFFAERQLRRFQQILEQLAEAGVAVPIRHAANSAGILSLPQSRLDMVRPGILAYGFYPSARVPRSIEVSGVMSFKSRVVQIREVPAGRFISYGRTYQTARATRVGVLPVGYGHGLPWLLSNRGEVLIRGRRAPMIGRVTMDLTMVDVTEIPDVALGDEAVLWGEQKGASITLEEVAERAETIPYEILCSMGKRVVRVFLRDGRPVKILTLVGERQESDAGTGARRARTVQYKSTRIPG